MSLKTCERARARSLALLSGAGAVADDVALHVTKTKGKTRDRMEAVEEGFVDLLQERRKDSDIRWVSRTMKPLPPHKLPKELIFTRKQAIEAVLADPRVLAVIRNVADARNVSEATVVAEANGMLQEMASKANLPTVRWIGEFYITTCRINLEDMIVDELNGFFCFFFLFSLQV